jgi:hypothetical protein
LPSAITPASDNACADWLRESLRSWGTDEGTTVGSVAPAHYEAFARVRKEEGDSLSREQASRLAALLGASDPPRTVYFALWDGYGGLAALAPPNVPALTTPQRRYLLFEGPPAGIASFEWFEGYYFAPDIWWADHQRWCVGSDTDLGHVYTGGSATAMRALLDDRRLGAEEMDVDYRIDLDPHAGV